MKKIIAVTHGDGCGLEVVEEGIKILKAISEYSDFDFDFINAPAGGKVWKDCGESLP
ncbi:MAG: isocitrate/isopropylmalate family dehydrogenase, partial [Candidatus Odinarchaeota archaeon]